MWYNIIEIYAKERKMGLFENLKIHLIKKRLNESIDASSLREIEVEGVKAYRDIPYHNRTGKELLMDIFEPENIPADAELPVIVNIHGGALIEGDKKYSAGFCKQVAKRGFLVFSLEYRLVPDVKVYEQFDDVCAGMDCVGRKLVDFNVDFRKIFVMGESAGAYLATYVAAMKKSKVLQEAIGYAPPKMTFKAMGLMSGMFYTTRDDKLGKFLADSFYGNDERSKAMAEYTNPEHPEIIYNIPPCYLITSKADMIERYTLDFAGELGNKGVEHKLRHMGSDPKLIHAFPVLHPDWKESERVIDEMVEWFNEHSPKD